MGDVFAGLVCGYALALIATPLAALALVRARVTSTTLQQVVPKGASLLAVSVILHGFALMAFTAVGMLMGVVLNGVESDHPAGGLGSPNGVFTAFVLITAAIAVAPLALVLPRWRVRLLASALLFAVVFGWLMPYLAELAPNQG